MKKFIIVILAAVLLAGIASAEDQLFSKPLKDMTREELQAAELAINNELLDRFGWIDGLVLEPGLYIVGEDFPAGSYYFEGVEGRFSSSLYSYPSKDKMGTFDSLQEIHGIGSDTPKTGRVILEDGNTVKFVQGPVIIHVYKGLMN